MTSEEYVRDDGESCPDCGSKVLIKADAYCESISAYQSVYCDNCRARWKETFLLTGIIRL